MTLPTSVSAAEAPLLPDTIWAAQGIESNIYFSSLGIANQTGVYFDVQSEKGTQLNARWTLKPSENDTRPFTLSIHVSNDLEETVATEKTEVRVASADAGKGKSFRLLAIGDSLTAGGAYTARLIQRFDGANQPQLTLLGSKGEEKNRHEGRPGWTYDRYLTQLTPEASPFLVPGDASPPVFDFARYLQTHCKGETPDFVILFLGTNDVFNLKSENRQTGVRKVIADAEAMIFGIRKGAPKAKIALIGPLPGASQDAFGKNYGCAQTSRGYRLNQHHYTREFLQTFQKRTDQGIYVIPTYLNFDAENGYPVVEEKTSEHSSTRVVRQSNGVHPNGEGHWQIADTIYAWVKNMMQEDERRSVAPRP